MAQPIKTSLTLDRERTLTWGPRASMRLNSLARRPNRRGLYAMACTLWAMLDDDDGFPLPDDLAEHLVTPEQVQAAGKAILQAQQQADDTGKNAHGSKRKPAPASS